MRIIEEEIDGVFYTSHAMEEYFSGCRMVAADIETTGLSPKNAVVMLGGAIIEADGKRKVIQFFGDIPEDEAELLERYVALLSQYDVIITYNGQRFDIPFLLYRMKRHHLDTAGLERLYSLDLYRVVRYHSHLPEILPNLKQKTVEGYLTGGSARTDEISGAESIALYNEYMRSTGEMRGQLLDTILLHNRDDLVQLSELLQLLKMLDLHEIMASCGFPLQAADAEIRLQKIRLSGAKLKAEGKVIGKVVSEKYFADGYTLTVDKQDGTLQLQLDCCKVGNGIAADLQQLSLDTPPLAELSGYESGFLILRDGEEIYWREINRLLQAILEKTITC